MAWFWWYLLWIWKYSFSERSWLVSDGCSNVLQQRLWEGVQHQAELWRLLQVAWTKNGSIKNLEQYIFKIIITMQVSSWWSLFSRRLQGLELLSGFEHYANVTPFTAFFFFSEQINRLHHFPEHTRLCSGQAQQCEADQPREDHGQPEQGARTCGGRDQTSYSAWR